MEKTPEYAQGWTQTGETIRAGTASRACIVAEKGGSKLEPLLKNRTRARERWGQREIRREKGKNRRRGIFRRVRPLGEGERARRYKAPGAVTKRERKKKPTKDRREGRDERLVSVRGGYMGEKRGRQSRSLQGYIPQKTEAMG